MIEIPACVGAFPVSMANPVRDVSNNCGELANKCKKSKSECVRYFEYLLRVDL